MAEALAALGVACNVLAVIDFTWKLLTEAREIHKTGAGASDNVLFVETIVNDVKYHNDRLANSHTNDKRLRGLVNDSEKITEQLSDALFKMRRKDRRSKWDSFGAALKAVLRDKDIKQLTERLSSLQTQISRHILVSISNEVEQTGRSVGALTAMISGLEITNSQLKVQRDLGLKVLEDKLMNAVKAATSIEGAHFQTLYHAITQGKDARRSNESLDALQLPGESLAAAQELSKIAELTQKDQDLLQSLHYITQMRRYQNIERAHQKTFDWILQDNAQQGPGNNNPEFKEWLKSSNDIYWISGKPGSGKSTLMKFLAENQKTEQFLRVWADGKPLITAYFYFWNAGSALQKSQEGLLRSIIFEFLRKCPDLIPAVRTAMYIESKFDHENHKWDINELLSMYFAIVRHNVDIQFCLFIDGLDEFEEERRTPLDLLNTIRRLNCSSNIKLCLSSRPWTEFRDEFGNDGKHLKLEDLTRGDIERYVIDHFESHPQFQELRAHDVAYAELVQLVLERAEGVFLWVYLVVRELLQGLTHHDTIGMLRRRLDHFPPDLERVFMALINLINPIYYKHMAQYFFLAVAAKNPLPARYYSFMDDLEDTESAVLSVEGAINHMSAQEDSRRENQLRRRLDGRTRGLLELSCTEKHRGSISGFWISDVEFLHRTVRDFLHDSQFIQELFERELVDRRPSLRACEAIAFSIATIPHGGQGDGPAVSAEKDVDVENLFFFASLCLKSPSSRAELKDLMIDAEEADRILRATFGRPKRPNSFLGKSAAIGFYDYLEMGFNSRPELFTTARRPGEDFPLLHYAIHFGDSPSLECMTFLLEKGARLNEAFEDESSDSVWHGFLNSVGQQDLILEKRTLHDLVRLFVTYGADFTVSRIDKNTYTTVRLLTRFLDSRTALQLHELFLQKQSERDAIVVRNTKRRKHRIFRWF